MSEEPDLNDAEKALLRAIANQGKAIKRWDEKIKTLRKSFTHSCRHAQTVDFHWEHDNGYGHQSQCIGKRCIFCQKKNYYPTMTGTWRSDESSERWSE